VSVGRILIVTGASGAGKTATVRALDTFKGVIAIPCLRERCAWHAPWDATTWCASSNTWSRWSLLPWGLDRPQGWRTT